MPSTQQRFYVDAQGKYLGSFTGFQHPDDVALARDGSLILVDGEPVVLKVGEVIDNAPMGGIEVPLPPSDGHDTWDGIKWIPAAPLPKAPDLTALVQALLKKGVITQND